MAHTVKLKPEHQAVLLEALLCSLEAKAAFVRAEKHAAAKKQYEDAGAKLLKSVSCGRIGETAADNLFGWIRDQLLHSGDFTHTELAQRAIDICEAAGNNQYDRFCNRNIYDSLFGA